MPSIFVSIASYRDPELGPTIRSLIGNRATDASLAIRILTQGDPQEGLADDPAADIPGVAIRETIVPAAMSRGVCWARAEIARDYAGEDFYLQLDSHTMLAPGWDEMLLADQRAASARGRPAILTAYLPGYTLTPAGRQIETTRPVHFRVVQEGWLPTARQTLGYPHAQPARAPFFSGHFAFAPGALVSDVPYDPELFFFGEEISMALRAYCCGYDLFTPSRFVGAHLYERLAAPERPRALYWDADEDAVRPIDAAELDHASLMKVAAICRGAWRGRYGIRDMDRYRQFRAMLRDRFDVDLARATYPA